MDLLKILKKVGGRLITSAIPGIGVAKGIIGTVNDFLPDDQKLSEDATGTDMERAIESLPPDKRVELLSKKFEVEIVKEQEWSNVIATLAEVDKMGASTRPGVAKIAIWFFAIFGGIFALVICWSIIWGKPETLKNLQALWPLVLSILGPPVALLERYFGKRTKEKQARYAGAFGSPLQGGILASVISAIKR